MFMGLFRLFRLVPTKKEESGDRGESRCIRVPYRQRDCRIEIGATTRAREFGKFPSRQPAHKLSIHSKSARYVERRQALRVRIPSDGDQRSEVMAIAIPN